MIATLPEEQLKPLRVAWQQASEKSAKLAAECTRIAGLLKSQRPQGRRLARMTKHYEDLCNKCLAAEAEQQVAWAAYAEPAGLRKWARGRIAAQEITG